MADNNNRVYALNTGLDEGIEKKKLKQTLRESGQKLEVLTEPTF